MRVLYLGLDPERYPTKVIHYPVIRTERVFSSQAEEAISLWSEFTHAIFTSRTSVFYWKQDLRRKTVIAIGSATAELLHCPLVSQTPTQEGIIDLLKTIDLQDAFVFLPHSRRSRPHLREFLEKQNVRHIALELYDTRVQKPDIPISLETVDEIVFTSPSTVEGFLKIFGKIPEDRKLTCIGPVTEAALFSYRKFEWEL
ncbi:MAG: hypothetical protein A3E80_03465 [Chlamydiae bacterium RIFCSPHIGHO2_12_FULL_49_9]|nr:MAG: hypothetical protein A3E80_03465 [Chlamydiae bacterium RIFCSPHIGHO2_12_FULL_49_9]